MSRNIPESLHQEVRGILRGSGIGVSLEWVKQSIEYLSKKGCISTEPKALAARVYSLFLDSDLHEIASEEGTLPANAQSIEFGMLCLSDDILILQVDEVVNVGSSAAFSKPSPDDDDSMPTRGPIAGNTRMLKLFLTDGRQQLVGLELRPMSLLSLDLPPGSKVKLRASHTPIRRGTAMLSAECLVLLGGSVERLVGFKPLQGLDSSETHKMDVVQSGAGQMPPPLFNSRPTQVFAQKQQQPIHQQQQPIHQQQQPIHQQQYSTQNQNNSNSLQMDSVRSVHPVTDFQASSSSSRGPNVQASSAINSIIGHDPLPSPAPSSSKPSLQSAPPQVRRQQDEYVVGGRSDANTNASYGGVRVRVASPVSSRDADQVLDLCSPGTPPPHSPRKNSDESLLVAVRRVEDSRLHGSLKSADGGAAPVRGDRDPLVTSAANLYTPQSHSRLGVLPTVAQPGPAAHSSAPLPASSSGWNSPAMKHQVPQSANSSSTALDGRVRKAPLSVSASVNLSVSANQNPNALPYVSLATVAAAMSAGATAGAGADTGADVGHSRKLPQGDFNVRGTAVNIRKFRVTEADGYLVLLSLEEEAADRDVPMGGSVVVPVLVSNDLCVKYLELAPTDYLLKLKNIGKEEIKSVKTSHSLKFRDFRGSFRARLAPSSALPGDRGLSGGTGATPAKSSSSSATSQGEDPLLLLVDFYE